MNDHVPNRSPFDPHIRQLLAASIEGQLDDAERLELAGLLQGRSEIVKQYVSQMTAHALLHWRHAKADCLPKQSDRAEEESAHRQRQESKPTNAHTKDAQRPLLRVIGFLQSASHRSPVTNTLLVATLLYGCFGLLVWQMSRYSTTPSGTLDVATYVSTPVDPLGNSPQKTNAARLTASADARWVETLGYQADGSPLKPGQQLRLASGVVQLDFNDGARVTIEGPCEFEVVSSNSGYLRLGKVVALVPQSATGFRMKTPTATVVDLGTEFGVEVQPKGRTAVEVFQGKVLIEPSTSASDQAIVVQAKENRRVEIDPVTGPAVMPKDGGRPISFKRSLQHLTATENAQEIKGNLVDVLKVDKPLAIWRISEGRKAIVWNAAGARNHGRLSGDVKQPGQFDGIDDYAEFRNLVSADFTLELWLKTRTSNRRNEQGTPRLPSPHYGRTIVWADVELAGDDYGLVIFEDVLHFWEGDAHKTDHMIAGKTKLIDDRWHHVVVTRQRGQRGGLKLYVDGAVDAAEDAQSNALQASELMFVGGSPGLEPWHYFQGSLDFVTVYDRVLDSKRIKNHEAAGRQ